MGKAGTDAIKQAGREGKAKHLADCGSSHGRRIKPARKLRQSRQRNAKSCYQGSRHLVRMGIFRSARHSQAIRFASQNSNDYSHRLCGCDARFSCDNH
jgi:hypothetical protein